MIKCLKPIELPIKIHVIIQASISGFLGSSSDTCGIEIQDKFRLNIAGNV